MLSPPFEPADSIFYQWVNQDGFHICSVPFTGSVHSSATAGSSQFNPVGCPVTPTIITLPVHQRFHQQGIQPMMASPVLSKPTQDTRKQQTGKITYPGQDQQSTVIYDLLKTSPACRVIPANPLIPGLHPPSWTGELNTADNLSNGTGLRIPDIEASLQRAWHIQDSGNGLQDL